jgi:4-amino-4-deoxy-L-arabinose transferase-like glycosyltransferase
MPKWLTAAAMAAIVALYAGLSFYQINLPGLHYDEAFESVPAVQMLTGQPVTAFRNSGLTLAGQFFPLMTQDYIGAINTYLALPFIAALGSTPVALRSMSIVTGAVTLLLTGALAARLTRQPWIGVLAALLLAVDPTFIFWNRQGVFVTAVTATIGVGAAYAWTRRLEGGSMRWSMAGGFLFGLGLYAKFLFLWLMAAMVGAVIALNLGRWWSQRVNLITLGRQMAFSEGLAVSLAFLAGVWPLLLYNLQTGGTIINITQNSQSSYYGVNNLAFGPNLLTRMSQFFALLNGSHFWYLGDIISKPLASVVFFRLTGVVIGTAILGRNTSSPGPAMAFSPIKIALFPLLVIGLVIVASIGTVSALWITHFAVIMPWPSLALALGSWFIVKQWSQRVRTVALIIGVALSLLIVTNLSSIGRYHQALSKSGGLSAHSDAVYDLSNWLDNHATGVVVAMDWGLSAPVIYLTHGRVNAVEVFGYQWQPDAELTDRLTRFIDQPDTLYLWRTPEEIIFDRSDEFKALYRPRDMEETIEELSMSKRPPLLGITRLVKKGSAENPPK